MFGEPRPDALHAEREVKWKEIMSRLNRITDGLGMPVDPEIKESVAGCIANGFDTYQSCGGHLEDGRLRMPWIVLQAYQEPEERHVGINALTKKIHERFGITGGEILNHPEADLMWDIESSRLPISEEWKAWERANEEMREKMKELLQEFYRERVAKYPLFIDMDSLVVLPIRESMDITFKRKSAPSDYRDRIYGGREEFAAFGAWLKERFLREGAYIGNKPLNG